MSANFTISFVANESNEYVKIHKQLFYWIIKECSNYKIKELSDSANYTVNYIDEIEVKHGLDSNSVLIIDFVYNKRIPFEINGSFWFYGNKYNGGLAAKKSGNLFITFAERDIWYKRNFYLSKENYDKAREYEITVLFEISELFNELILVCEDFLSYSSFYSESGLRTPFRCSMAYYSNYREFVRDFTRVQFESKTGIYFSNYYNINKVTDNIGEVIDEIFYKNFTDKRRGNLLSFLDEINSNHIQKLNSISEFEIEEILQIVLSKNFDVIFTMTKKGFTLCTYPLLGLWIVYYDFFKYIFDPDGSDISTQR